jgi:hypothetical protein
MKNRIEELTRRVADVKRAILELGDLQPGTLSKQYNVCGNPRCRCKATPPKRHGPYYQLSFTRKNRSRTKFVRKEHLHAVREHVKNFTRLRKLVDRLIDLSADLAALKLTEDQA